MATTMAGVFRCPSCKEFISVDASTCRFCSVAVNAQEAQELSRRQSDLDNAIAGARNIKYMFIPFLILIPATGIIMSPAWPVVLAIILEIMCVRWLTSFRSVHTPEADRLRRQVLIIAVLTAAELALVMFGFVQLFLLSRK